MGEGAPNPSHAGLWELPKSEEKKLELGVPADLGQTNYAENMYFSYKLDFKTK